MTLKDFETLGLEDRDISLEKEALQIAGFESGAEDYGVDEQQALQNSKAAGTSDSTAPD